jgi:hypothetical protein
VASHAHRFGLLELPRPGRAALPLVALAVAALALEGQVEAGLLRDFGQALANLQVAYADAASGASSGDSV